MTSFLLLAASAFAGKHAIVGTVVDRNGDPVPRAVVSVTVTAKKQASYNVSLMTDRRGTYRVDYLRPDGAERRIKLQKRAEYEIEVFKPGFHLHDAGVYFRKGEMTVAPITLVEETIAVQDLPENLDPGANSDAATSTGATFEWQ
ncbi:MAG: carboxypeptidase-like regulatory domain-containing protein [Myxococcota bacterium]